MQVDLFQLMQDRLNWTQRRQTVLAQNIANADTPRYQPRDLPAFHAQLARQRMRSISPRRLSRPSPPRQTGLRLSTRSTATPFRWRTK
jgi:flagellar basal-body rod protein FlgB